MHAMNTENSLRSQLALHLKGGMAFLPIDTLIHEIPFERLSAVPENLPYSLWQQFWHMMYAQKDILEFCIKSEYKEPAWPDDYWPENYGPENKEEWDTAVRQFFDDRNRLIELVRDESADLFAPLKNDSSKNLFREVMLVIEHNAYHTGQMLVIARLLGLHG
jgi:uncharacterized damage-inducible protein DinB